MQWRTSYGTGFCGSVPCPPIQRGDGDTALWGSGRLRQRQATDTRHDQAAPQEQAMGRDVVLFLIGVPLPIMLLLFLAWQYLL